jgi:hypothetical protein
MKREHDQEIDRKHFYCTGKHSILNSLCSGNCTTIDETQHNNLCESCHDSITAPFVKTHSSIQTDNGYGDWSVECRTCHNPHEQMQFREYGSESHLYSEQSDDIQLDTPAAGQSQLTDNEASWTPDEYQGFVLIANINDSTTGFRGFGYEILSNTATILTVDGNIDTAKAPIGSDFAIIYGNIIRELVTLDDIIRYCSQSTSVPDQNNLTESGAGWTTDQFAGLTLIPNIVHPDSTYTIQGNTSETITTVQPMDMGKIQVGRDFKVVGIKTGDKAVKFFNNTGTNSFADGDTTYDGICEVCHTQTDHFRNDGTGPDQDHTSQGPSVPGSNCSACHSHVEGFKGAGDCIGCHNTARSGVYSPRQIVENAGDGMGDFVKASRHVSNGTTNEIITNYDCAVCHAEGDVTKINAATGWTSDTLHNDGSTSTDRMVNLRNLDNYAGATYDFNKNTVDETMRDDMDSFCLSCHDNDGASDITVNSTDDGLDTGGSVTRNLTPFNTNDNLENANDGLTTRTRVIDVDSQYDTANPSHHAVKGQRYTTRHSDTNAGEWDTGTWTTHTLRNGDTQSTVMETATLHCSDCHLSENNAHGAANAWHMLLNGVAGDFTSDTTMGDIQLDTSPGPGNHLVCYKCHNRNVYMGNNPSAGSRFTHDEDSDWYDDDYGTGQGEPAYLGPNCLQCHAGDGFGHIHGRGSATDGDDGTYADDDWTGSNSYTKYRFMPGAWMRWSPRAGGPQADPDDAYWNLTQSGDMCYFPAAQTSWSACTSHSGSDKKSGSNYARPTSY